MYTLYSPYEVILSSGKPFKMNLNVYRNAHYRVLHEAKKAFSELIWDCVAPLPKMQGCTLKYSIHPLTRRKIDISNVGSVVDKFFCDLLVQSGKLPDDNYERIPEVSYVFGGLSDSGHAYVKIFLTPLPNKGTLP